MKSSEIHRRFLDFFASRGHQVIPSASLLVDDPTLLFVNAGMVPFKPIFLGEFPSPYRTAASIQKCVRTLDIDEVGRTARHASFFQMAGNFSFGDYFKQEAITLAWELLTSSVEDGGYGFPIDRLWITVYEDDDESISIWNDIIGVPLERIQKRGMLDNFWSMGVPGPCGPCSEIYYDRGPLYGVEGGPIADENRYMEIWNLVFMQNIRGDGPGKDGYPILGDLPAKNIDTGMGIERMATILQGVENLCEIDTSRVTLDRASELSGTVYGIDPVGDVALRVIADHVKAAVFLLGDGAVPGNSSQGYVVRRLLRRSIQKMRSLGAKGPTIGELVDTVISSMSHQYPELQDGHQVIRAIAEREETVFLRTLVHGEKIFSAEVERAKASGESKLSGAKVFTLHDTYGFPYDLTCELAEEEDMTVDEDGYRFLMQQQKDRAKADTLKRKER